MNPAEQTPTIRSEQLARLATERESTDWRRIEAASNRFGDFIANGIGQATHNRSDIDESTARCIAHVLGRGVGRASALAEFGRTTNCDYDQMRDEFLQLYTDTEAPAWAREQIDWLGTHLIRRIYPDAQTIRDPELYPPTLEQLLVPTMVEVGDWAIVVHVPGIYNGDVIANDLAPALAELHADEDAGLRAFLSLPNVNAMSGDIMGDFDNAYQGSYESEEDALVELCEMEQRQQEILDHAAELRWCIENMTPDIDGLRDDVSVAFDLVTDETTGRAYVFAK